MIYAFGAYVLWGILPLYWKLLAHVPSMAIMCHRIFFSLVFLALLPRLMPIQILKNLPLRTLLRHLTAAIFIGLNWWLFIYAINTNRILEASLGYFLCPLVMSALGILVLGERTNLAQSLALVLAFAGVASMTFIIGSLPWIALCLAFSFALYSLLRKASPLGSLEGLYVETVLLIPVALYVLWDLHLKAEPIFGHQTTLDWVLLAGTGPVTAIPLMLFARGVRELTLISTSFMHYIGPTLQLFLGLVVYKESMTLAQKIGFPFIWAAVILYCLNLWVQHARFRVDRSGQKNLSH